MSNEIPSSTRKFTTNEFGIKKPITAKLMYDMAAALNAFCDFSNVRCEFFDQDGVFTSSSIKSQLLVIGIGGGGGGGTGGRGSIRGSGGTPNVDGTSGGIGLNGTNTTFGGSLVGTGGQRGLGGRFLENINEEINEDLFNLQNINTFWDGIFSHTFNGSEYGNGGQSSNGERARVYNSVSGNFVGYSFAGTGTRGQNGKRGNLGFLHLDSQPNTDYSIVIGLGGAGGIAPAQQSINTGGGVRFSSPVPNGEDGKNGALMVIEFGF